MEKFLIKDDICLFTERYGFSNTYVNLYIVKDEEPALINVGPPEKVQDFLDFVDSHIPLKDIRYVFLLDSEREHVGGIPLVVSRMPGARYITSYLNYDLIVNYTADIRLEMMREKWKMKLGKNEVRFFEAMIPTPESLFLYIDGILFTGSAFALDYKGTNIDDSDRSEDIEELFHLFRKRAHKIAEYMGKLEHFPIKIIAPAHGPVLKGRISRYIEQWKNLSNLYRGQN